MKFSLKTLLIVLIATGVVAGILGRLCFSHPEKALSLIALLAYAGPLVLAVGTVIWIGFRGRESWATPVCASCGRDLRRIEPDRATACPACGSDLTTSGAVRFARDRRPRWGLVVWGALLIISPIAGFGLVFGLSQFIGSSPGNLRAQSTQQLVQQQLPKRVDEPWVWNELNTRLAAGSLSQQEVDDAIKQLIAHMKATNPNGYDRPLSWQGDFLQAASRANKISKPVFLDLCDAFYGPKPTVQPLPRIRESSNHLEIQVEYGNTWGRNSGLGVELLWAVNQVLLDGEPLQVRQNHKHGESWSGTYEGNLPAGDYTVSVEVECAYVDQDKLIGLNADDLPTNRWPKARKRWRQTVSAPLKVYTQQATIVPLTTDPRRKPDPTGGIQVQRCVVQTDRDDKKKIVLKIQYTAGSSVPLSCDVAVKIEDQVIELGHLWVVREQNRTSHSNTQFEGKVDTLDPDTTYLDVILTPNPSHIEQRAEVTEIWGGEIVLAGVPIERLDLEAGGS